MHVRGWRSGLVVFVGVAAGFGASADPGQSENDEDAKRVVLWKRGQAPFAPSTSNLIDHGGKILPTSHVYTIWWGSSGAWPADYKTGIDALFYGLEGTNFLNIATQYMRGSSTTAQYVPSNFTDPSSPPKRNPSVSTIVNEACNVIHANGLSADAYALYFVFTSNFPHVNYCAWHSYGTCDGQIIQVAYMPNLAGVSGCDPLTTSAGNFGCNTYSEDTQALGNVASHEFMETITDANLSAWYDSSGSEIGDKCAWQFSQCVNLTTGNWQLQEEWSNAAGGCVQQ